MRTLPLALVAATVFLAPAANIAIAATISLNFEGDDSNGASANNLGPSEVAGVAPAARWTNLSGATGSRSNLPDDSGNPTGAAVTWVGQGLWSWENSGRAVPGNPNGAMFNGYLDSVSDGSHTVTVSQIPFAQYDVVVYVDGENIGQGRPARINVGGADIFVNDDSNWDGTFVEGTGDSLATATPGANYVRFTGLTASSVTITSHAEPFRTAINGLQIVGTVAVEGLPEVENEPASNLAPTAARLHGHLVSNGQGAEPATLTIYYGPADGGTSATGWAASAAAGSRTSPGAFFADVTGLAPNTTVHFRAFASNSAGDDWAPGSATFATPAALPSVTNNAASAVQASRATIGATVTASGGDNPAVTLYYGTTDRGATATGWEGSAALGTLGGGASATSTLTGLSQGTTYHYRAAATNSAGTAFAPTTSTFTTPEAALPAVASNPAESITGTSARLGGTVTSTGNDPPSIVIYYGPADGGTSAAAWEGSANLGIQGAGFERTVSGLAPLTDYFFRIRATNAAGAAWSQATGSFATPESVPQTIVINELHIDPPTKTERAEFVELYNNSDGPVDLSGWQFTSGIAFTFPNGTTLGAGEFLVVAEDPATVLSKFGVAGALGPFEGKLRNSGETIELSDASGSPVDEVDYGLGFPWPVTGEAPGSSIELINPGLANDVGGHWRSSGNGGTTSTVAPTTYIGRSGTWRYRKGTAYPSTDGTGREWFENGYDEGADPEWLSGVTPIGFGDGDDVTELNDMQGNYITFFARHEFSIAPGQVPPTLDLGLHYDDGVIVWINGVEVMRTPNVSSGPIPFPPPGGFAGNHEADTTLPYDFDLFTLAGAGSYLVEGTNTLALQLINNSLSSSDASLDAELGTGGIGPGGFSPAPPTPGATNSVFATNAPPAIRKVDHAPAQPATGAPVTVTAKITDPDGVSAATLEYQVVEPGDYLALGDPRYLTEWVSIPMADTGTGDDIFGAVIPASVQSHRRLVRYRIVAADPSNTGVRVPYRDDPQPNFAYFVYDGIPAYTAKATPTSPDVTYDFGALPPLQQDVPVYHLITTRQHHVDSQFIPNSTRGGGYSGSDYLWHGALVYDGRVYDHIRFRARGGVWRYAMGKNMWKFDFNRSHRLRAHDEYGRAYDTEWDKLNFSALIQQGDFQQRGEQGIFEGAGFRLHNLADNAAPKSHYVHFRIIEDESESGPTASQFDDDFQGLYMAIEQMDGAFLDEHALPDGNLYKMEGGTGELNNQGPDQPSDKSDLNAFLSAYSGGATQPVSWWRTNVNLDDYYSFRAIATFIHDYDIGGNKNFFFYHHPETGQWEMKNWDLDLTWTTTYNGFGETDAWSNDILAIPALALERRNRMRELRDLLLNPEQTGMLIDEIVQFAYTPGQPSYVDADRAMWDYNPILASGYVNPSKAGHGRFYQSTGPRTFAAMVERVKNYVATRAAFVDSSILTDESQVPATPTLTYSGLDGFPSNGITVGSSAYSSPSGSPFAAMEYRLAEVTDPDSLAFDPSTPRKYEVETDWESGLLPTFTASQKIPAAEIRSGNTYRARVRHQDAAGRWGHWSAPVEFVATAPDVAPFQQSLVISEIHYHPADPTTAAELAASTENDDFEFIELLNVGTGFLDLTDVRFTKGIDFDFAPGTTLAPGARILAVKNVAAFEARYGAGLPVAGSYGDDNLSNGGENLKLSLGAGNAIHEFTYDDDPPWPTGADGDGFSLVLIDPTSLPDHADPASWRLSRHHGGSPGTSDSLTLATWMAEHGITDPLGNEDGDALINFLEFAFGSPPHSPSNDHAPKVTLEGGFLTVAFRRNLSAEDLTFTTELSEDLATWDPAAAVLFESSDNGDGTATETWRALDSLPDTTRQFVRVRVSAP
ncbi:hypothetical protein BH23VER1_BH23VER1_20210 [soil metagenome]